MKLASTRDGRPNDLHRDFRRTVVAGSFHAGWKTLRVEARRGWFAPKTRSASRFAARLVAAVYFGVALAAPALILVGPEVMPPSATAITDKALDGQLAHELHWPHST